MEGSLQLCLSSFEISPTVREEFKGFPSSWNKSPEGHQEGICSHTVKQLVCMQRIVKYLNRMPHLFSERRPTLTVKGPKQSMPVDQKAGLDNLRRAGRRSAILGMTGLALHLWHSRHWCWCCRMAWQPRRIQYRHLISPSTRSEPGWSSFSS